MKNLKIIFILTLIMYANSLYADGTKALNSLLFGRQPTARAEAMGKSLDLLTFDPACTFYNPANLGRTEFLTAGGAYASPYYLAEDAFFTNFNTSASLGMIGAISLNRFDFNLGEKAYVTNLSGEGLDSYDYHETLYTLSYARPVPGGFYVGANLNLAQLRLNKTDNAFTADFGVIKQFNFVKNDLFKYEAAAGISLTNVFNTSLKYDNLVSDNSLSDKLPSVMRIGLSDRLVYNGVHPLNNLNFLSAILHIEYFNLINSAINKGYRIGSELSVLELVYLRAGYFKERVDKSGYPENEKYLKNFTYGFGVQLPFQELNIVNIPLKIRFDYTRLEPPSYTTLTKEWDDFTSWNVNVFLNVDMFKSN